MQVVKNAFKIFNKDKEKWYTLVAYDADSKTQWLHAFGEAGIIVEKASSFDPSKYDHPDLTAGLTNEEAMAIMIKVRDGKLNVDAALELAKESSAKAVEKDATPATVDMDKDVNDELILVLGATGTIGQRVASKVTFPTGFDLRLSGFLRVHLVTQMTHLVASLRLVRGDSLTSAHACDHSCSRPEPEFVWALGTPRSWRNLLIVVPTW